MGIVIIPSIHPDDSPLELLIKDTQEVLLRQAREYDEQSRTSSVVFQAVIVRDKI